MTNPVNAKGSISDYNGLNVVHKHPQNKYIHQLFEEQAEQIPTAIAIQNATLFTSDWLKPSSVPWNQDCLTYCELNAQANQLARQLQAMNVGHETLVALCLERSLAMVVAVLAIFKTGGACVPMEPDYPQERLLFMLKDTGVRVILTQEHLAQKLSLSAIPTLCLDSDWSEVDRQGSHNLSVAIEADNLAYVIYTSGSTGQPKGVMIEHRSLVSHINTIVAEYQFTAQDRVLQFASICFDVAFEQIFSALCVGGMLLIRGSDIWSQEQFDQQLIKHHLTVVDLPPTYFHLLIEKWLEQPPFFLSQLRLILIGGEKIRPELLLLWQQLPQSKPQLINAYGPTETTITATHFDLSNYQLRDLSQNLPIGKVFSDRKAYILDPNLQAVVTGDSGELYIGGMGVARGYLNQPALTAERFITHPSTNERLYKTGDMTRWLSDGNIEFIGRVDHQIKIRGFRIELGEIEVLLDSHPLVHVAVVSVYQENGTQQLLVAYIVQCQKNINEELAIHDLRDYLKQQLPDYMIPSAFVILDSLPMTANGKIDRHALPAPDREALGLAESFAPPETETEIKLVAIWRMVLDVNEIGIHDNFFRLGGDSLKSVRVINELQKHFKHDFLVLDLFKRPTVAQLAAHIASRHEQSDTSKLIVPVLRNRPMPLSLMQEQTWHFSQENDVKGIYTILERVNLTGVLNLTALRQSFDLVIQRHESLRTSFSTVNGDPVQIIDPACKADIYIIDLSQLSAHEQMQELERLEIERGFCTFDLTQSPLMYLTLLRLSKKLHLLLIALHHIIADDWSVQLLHEEWTSYYTDLVANNAIKPVAPLSIHYADFAWWQRRYYTQEVLAKRLTYWQQLLSNPILPLALHTDFPRQPVSRQHKFESGVESFEFTADLTRQLKKFSLTHEVTLFTTLLAGYALLLHQFSDSDDMWIAAPMSKRNHSSLDKLIGFFSSMSLLRVQVNDSLTFEELLRHVQEVLLAALANQDITLQQVIHSIADDGLPEKPNVRAILNFIASPYPERVMPGLVATINSQASRSINVDITLTFWEETHSDKGLILAGYFVYRKDLFKAETIEQLSKALQRIFQTQVY